MDAPPEAMRLSGRMREGTDDGGEAMSRGSSSEAYHSLSMRVRESETYVEEKCMCRDQWKDRWTISL